jgi:hypothetical protein
VKLARHAIWPNQKTSVCAALPSAAKATRESTMANDPMVLAVINESSRLSDAEIATHVAAVQEQMDSDVGPAWKFRVQLRQIPKGDPPPANQSWMVYLDNTDKAFALSYHEQTSTGHPIGKVFVETTIGAGNSVSRVLSHEVAELMVNPDLKRLVPIGGRQYWVEVGDPLSLDQHGYFINGTLVSGIAYPDYFYGGGTIYDKNGLLQGRIPNAIHGTFLMWLENNQWQQEMFAIGPEADVIRVKVANRPQVGSRRYRRLLGEQNWCRSTVKAKY